MLSTALGESKHQLLQKMAGTVDRPACKQLEVCLTRNFYCEWKQPGCPVQPVNLQLYIIHNHLHTLIFHLVIQKIKVLQDTNCTMLSYVVKNKVYYSKS